MPHIASMGIYVVKADIMRELLIDKFATANDFGSEIIPGAVTDGKKVQVSRPSHSRRVALPARKSLHSHALSHNTTCCTNIAQVR